MPPTLLSGQGATITFNCFTMNSSELAFKHLLKSAKIPSLNFNSKTLIQTAKQFKMGRQRIATATPYIAAEFGDRATGQFNWDNIPASIILDLIFATDFAINFRGWHIAIDVTSNPNTLDDKQAKLNNVEANSGLKHLLDAIGIDHSVVCLVKIPGSRKPKIQPNIQTLTQLLRQVIKGSLQVGELAL
ncbi:MAG: hypothetical protein RH949_25230 [Coleofasciculus sp. A1-SPW-01]|nr:hypothetical protein [Coleofasciculus chthonoplastes]